MAVKNELSRNNIGTKLVTCAEKFVRKKNYRKIILHSRKTAVKFYEKLGYRKVGDEFIEVTIPHIKMEKSILI